MKVVREFEKWMKSKKHNLICNLLDLQSGKMDKFHTLLNSANSNMKELEECSWHGIPPSVRAITWRLLSVSYRFILMRFLPYIMFAHVLGIHSDQSRQAWTNAETKT